MNLATLQHGACYESYSQAVISINELVKWIETQAPTPYPANAPYTNAFNSFNIIKQDSIKWFNSIYPSCIQVLDSIIFDDTQVRSALDTMYSVSEQLQYDMNNEKLHMMIGANAQMLISTISGIKEKGDKVENASENFLMDLNTDFNNLNNARNGLMMEIQVQNNNLSSMYANLHSLESKSCKSEGDINACKAQINSQINLLNTLNNLNNLINQTLGQTGLVLQSLTYLKSFWSLITDDAENCINILNKITSDPVIILALDIQNAQNAWKELYNIANNTLQQLPASYKMDSK